MDSSPKLPVPGPPLCSLWQSWYTQRLLQPVAESRQLAAVEVADSLSHGLMKVAVVRCPAEVALERGLVPETVRPASSYHYTMKLRACLPLFPWLAAIASVGSLSAQGPADSTARDPHAVQPERPTVATHAGTVARGWVELEEGGEWDKASSGERSFFAPTNLKIGLATRAQLNLLVNLIHDRAIPGRSFAASDITIGIKYRIAENDR